MSVQLIIEPRTLAMTWEEFAELTPPFSVALNGFVDDGPRIDSKTPRANFNHDESVCQLETRATCSQVLIAVRQDFFLRFRNEEGPCALVFANDCDEDVCTSWFLLNHRHMVEGTLNPLLNWLVGFVDTLDATAGAYPHPKDTPYLRRLAWVFEPYRRFRMSGLIDEKDPIAFREVVAEVEKRILNHINGGVHELSLDLRYERIGGGNGWAMIREIGAQGMTGAFSDGIRAYISVREGEGGVHHYIVGRMSPFTPFDIPTILARLSEAEGPVKIRWGGGYASGRSPRATGSILSPQEVAKIVNETIR